MDSGTRITRRYKRLPKWTACRNVISPILTPIENERELPCHIHIGRGGGSVIRGPWSVRREAEWTRGRHGFLRNVCRGRAQHTVRGSVDPWPHCSPSFGQRVQNSPGNLLLNCQKGREIYVYSGSRTERERARVLQLGWDLEMRSWGVSGILNSTTKWIFKVIKFNFIISYIFLFIHLKDIFCLYH